MSSLLPSMRSLFRAAIFLLSSSPTPSSGGEPPTCPNPQTSCQNTTIVQDTCCFNAPGGLMLLTQFWDANPSIGPVDSWTIHGLWPDRCDGTYDAYCDPSREYANITSILTASGATTLLDYMNTYWPTNSGTAESFWSHEWDKHGTCISTLEPSCYTNYVPQEEVVEYFNKTIDLFKTLPSHAWLANAGIVPSSSATYTSAEILAALKTPRGVDVAIQCSNTTELDEIWYFYDVKGSVQSGTFIPTDPDGSKSSCPATGVKYLPKSGSASPTTSASTTNTPSPTTAPGTPFSGKGTLPATNGGSTKGCIISGGTWYVGGTCATFTATPSGAGFTLTSSKGKCAVQNNSLACGSAVTTATVFTSSGSNLAYDGSTAFFAGNVPSGSTQATVSTVAAAQALTIGWVSS